MDINIMYKILLLILVVMLSACSEENAFLDKRASYGYDYITVTSVKVKNTGTLHVPQSIIDSVYLQMQSCIGGSPNILLVIQEKDIPGYEQYSGVTFLDSLTVIINTTDRDISSVYGLIKHEFIHAFLEEYGFNRIKNTNHESTFFEICM